jgi:TonB-dependent receptor
LFVDGNINIPGLVSFTETTRPSDAYSAELDVLAAYVEGDVGLTRDVRLIVGERIEHTVQTVAGENQFSAGNFVATERADVNSTDLLPSVSLAYAVTPKTKLRAAVTRTLARPQVRELAPFAYTDYFNGRENGGNDDLVLTKIINADLRFEYFPTLREVAAFSFFYKNFKDPIEPVLLAGGATQATYKNAAGANLFGLELEGRKTLGFISKVLDDFTAIGNLTLARSRIQIEADEDKVSFMTNKSRALAQQAPYVLNIALDYTHEGTSARILYNVVGPRIVDIGTGGLDDSYEQPRHMVDLTASQDFLDHFQAKLAVRNLFNAPVRQTLGSEDRDDRLTRRYTTGAIYTISLSYNY